VVQPFPAVGRAGNASVWDFICMIALLTKLPLEILLEKRASIGLATLMIITPILYTVKERVARVPIGCLHHIETYFELFLVL